METKPKGQIELAAGDVLAADGARWRVLSVCEGSSARAIEISQRPAREIKRRITGDVVGVIKLRPRTRQFPTHVDADMVELVADRPRVFFNGKPWRTCAKRRALLKAAGIMPGDHVGAALDPQEAYLDSGAELAMAERGGAL